jgi:hypothetical protein
MAEGIHQHIMSSRHEILVNVQNETQERECTVKEKSSCAMLSITHIHMGKRCFTSAILNTNIKQRCVASFTLQMLYPQGKSPRYPLDKSLVGSRASLNRVEKNKISCPYQKQDPNSSDVQPITNYYPSSTGERE